MWRCAHREKQQIDVWIDELQDGKFPSRRGLACRSEPPMARPPRRCFDRGESESEHKGARYAQQIKRLLKSSLSLRSQFTDPAYNSESEQGRCSNIGRHATGWIESLRRRVIRFDENSNTSLAGLNASSTYLFSLTRERTATSSTKLT